jgi:hypothetical protein
MLDANGKPKDSVDQDTITYKKGRVISRPFSHYSSGFI